MTTSRADEAATLLLNAANGERLADLPPHLVPGSLADAYAIQDAALRDATGLAGWKIAPAKLGHEPRCSPIPNARMSGNGSALPITGFRTPEVEVEIGFLLGRNLPARGTPYVRHEVIRAVKSVHAALEILDSRFLDRKAVSPFSALADAQSNGAMIAGEGIEAWENLEFAQLGLELFADGEPYAVKTGGPSTDAVLDALTWLSNHAATRERSLEAGQFIITGARLGPLAIPRCTQMAAHVEGIGTVAVFVGD